METEDKIIRAALMQFETHGFIAATTKAIAAEAGVAEVTLFRIFGDKRTLFLRVANRIAGEFGVMKIPDPVSGDFREDIRRLCRGLLWHMIGFNAMFRMLFFEAKKHEDVRLILTQVRAGALQNIQARAGCFVKLPAETLAELVEWLGSSLIGASLCYCLFHETDDPQAFTDKQAELIADAFIKQCEQHIGEETHEHHSR